MKSGLCILVAIACDCAQVRCQALASEFSRLSQVVAAETIHVEYYRPRVRNRTVFGALVAFHKPWTPGANYATTLSVTADVTLNGVALSRGEYSIWFVPRPSEDWDVVVARFPRTYHLWPPSDDDIVARTTAPPRPAGEFVELLTWTVRHIARDAATLEFSWADTRIALQVILSITNRGERSEVRTGLWVKDSTGKPDVSYSLEEVSGQSTLRTSKTGHSETVQAMDDLGGCQFRPRALEGVSTDWRARGMLLELLPCDSSRPSERLRIWTWEGVLLWSARRRDEW